MDTTFLLNDILKSDGTNQDQRLLNALNPDFVKVDERGIRDLLSFTYQLSKEINYYNIENNIEGDWSEFFDYSYYFNADAAILDNTKIFSILQNKNDFDPHFALLLTFLNLFGNLQNDINAIPQRRLDFYLTKILRLQKKPPVVDKINLVLELSKNLSDHLLPAGTQFKAKSADGKTLIYTSDNEIVINKSQIASLKSLFIDAKDNNKIYTATVSNSADGMGKPFTGKTVKWSAFGESQQNKTDDERSMQLTDIGFAFSSPMLLMQEGERIIDLNIDFLDIGEELSLKDNDITSSVNIYLSGEKGWISPKSFTAVFKSNTSLSIAGCTLASDAAAVVAFNSSLHTGNFNTIWPVLKIVLKPETGLYNDLYNLQILSGDITVTVNGVKNLVAQNDQSSLDITKPFLPFGSMPAINSTLYLGSAEIFQKKLTYFRLDIVWDAVPQADLIDYYSSYVNNNQLTNLIFTVNISLLYKDQWLPVIRYFPFKGDYYLFQQDDASQIIHNVIGIREFLALSPFGYGRNTDLQQVTSYDNKTHDGFIKLELSGPLASSTGLQAFGHSQFSALYTRAAMILAENPTDFTKTLPNPPYTPSIKSLTLNYASKESINVADRNSPEQFFHIGPFGTAQNIGDFEYLLPQLRNEALLPKLKKDSKLYLGNFFIGLENLFPPQNISFLFQVAEGSADTEAIITDDDIQWSYLSGNKWKPFDKQDIIRDTTQGLQTSGIISFAIDDDATSDNTLMPAGFHWLRASTEKDPAGISEFIDIRTQAVQASFVNVGSDVNSTHADMFLPAGSITELVVKDAAVKSVRQPYQSFGGKPQENNTTFYARVSERLRHKQRALALWDYERMILDEFPEIFKVKCLIPSGSISGLQSGSLQAVVVPNLINKSSHDPLHPKVNSVKLTEIENYIDNYAPVFVNFTAINPVYEQLLVDCKVGFMPGKDAGFYTNLLNEEIKQFLSPWAYAAGQDITFGGKVFRSDILYFIENRDYVDFVNDFKLYHIFDGVDDTGPGIGDMIIETDFIINELIPPGIDEMAVEIDFVVGVDTEVAVASLPQSILVSANDHRIAVLNSATCQH